MSNGSCFDRLLVVDFEMTCFGTEPRPMGFEAEIIQVGMTTLNTKDLKIEETVSVIIRPEGRISNFCTDLTGLTQKDVRRGIPWHDACTHLVRAHGTRRTPWAAWGRDDEAVAAECERTGAQAPFSDSYIDLGALFGLAFGLDRSRSLTNALRDLGMTFEGRQHRADDDAYNTARIARELFRRMRSQTAEEGVSQTILASSAQEVTEMTNLPASSIAAIIANRN